TTPLHLQTQSPLFGILPPELRTIIFADALLLDADLTQPYSKHTYYYRPGFQHAQLIPAIALLATCRLIYLE
ncbi:hypothetical protein C8F01DRAFT_940529, partial [Mycena amicta]